MTNTFYVGQMVRLTSPDFVSECYPVGIITSTLFSALQPPATPDGCNCIAIVNPSQIRQYGWDRRTNVTLVPFLIKVALATKNGNNIKIALTFPSEMIPAEPNELLSLLETRISA